MQLWLSRAHFDFNDPWEHVDFQVRSTFDVVGGAGWRIASFQIAAELWIVRQGSVAIENGERQAVAVAPRAVVLRAGETRDTRHVDGPPISIIGFSFDATLWGTLDWVKMSEAPLVAPLPSSLTSLIERMVEESRARRAGYSMVIHGLGQLAFIELLRAQNVTVETQSALSRMAALARNPELRAVLQLIETRFDEPLDIAQMARAAHLSEKHFGRKFRMAFGLTPMEHLRRFWLNRARDLLAASGENSGSIAHRIGFADEAHLGRAFKREFGVTPGTFRRRILRGE